MYKLTKAMREKLNKGFEESFKATPERYFSASGRTEIGGNHTDHQQGLVLAAAVNLETLAAVRLNGSDTIRLQSEGYPLCLININELECRTDERGSTAALVRGVAAGFSRFGAKTKGFDAYVCSDVLRGSGLSSSAAFEVLLGTVFNSLFCDNKLSATDIAKIAQYAENTYFGKPCGLMDQLASAVGGFVFIDFENKENPKLEAVDYDLSKSGYALCIIDSKASHADLTDDYAAVTAELKSVCSCFGREVLREVSEAELYESLPMLRKTCGDRAVLRAIHVFEENRRVAKQVTALKSGDFDSFLQLVRESGKSSFMYLQNVIPMGATDSQALAMALALCEKLLDGKGAVRVHGGGFAGTVQAYVPLEVCKAFCDGVEAAFGRGACRQLSIRSYGATEMM